MSEKQPEFAEMSSVAEASVLLRRLAEPCPAGDSVKAAILRAARNVKLRVVGREKEQTMSPTRAEGLWYQEARMVRAEEMDAIRKAMAQRKKEQEAQNDFRDFEARLDVLEQRLAQADEEFFRPQVSAMRAAMGVVGPADSALDEAASERD